MDARITDLEVRYVYLERTVGELDQVVLELRAEIEKLKREVKDLTHMAHAEDGEDRTPLDEKPPHY
jgi:SlyX protein